MKVLTADGQTISGLTVAAGDPAVLKNSTGRVYTLAAEDIHEMRSAKMSMMPDLSSQLTAKEIASILAFLREMKME